MLKENCYIQTVAGRVVASNTIGPRFKVHCLLSAHSTLVWLIYQPIYLLVRLIPDCRQMSIRRKFDVWKIWNSIGALKINFLFGVKLNLAKGYLNLTSILRL